MGRGAWWTIFHGVAKSLTWLSDLHINTSFCDMVLILIVAGLWFFLLLPTLWWMRLRGFYKHFDGRDKVGKTRSCSSGSACACSSWGDPVYGLSGRVNGDLQEDLHQRAPSRTAAASETRPTYTSTGYPPTLARRSGSVSYRITAPFPSDLCTRFCLCPKGGSLCFPYSCGSPVIIAHWSPKSDSLGILSPFARSPGWKVWHKAQNLHNKGGNSLVLLFSRLRFAPSLGMRYDFHHVCTPPTISSLLLCLWNKEPTLSWWVSVSSCQWLFNS